MSRGLQLTNVAGRQLLRLPPQRRELHRAVVTLPFARRLFRRQHRKLRCQGFGLCLQCGCVTLEIIFGAFNFLCLSRALALQCGGFVIADRNEAPKLLRLGRRRRQQRVVVLVVVAHIVDFFLQRRNGRVAPLKALRQAFNV